MIKVTYVVAADTLQSAIGEFFSMCEAAGAEVESVAFEWMKYS